MYATLTQLCTQYGYREVSQLLSDEDAPLTEQMLRDALANADVTSYTPDEQAVIAVGMNRGNDALIRQSNFMDSKIATRYQLPLSDSAVAAAPLEECCLALTRAYLCDDSDNSSPIIEGGRTRWIKWLTGLARDETVIPGAAKVAAGGTQNGYHTAKPKGLDLSNY